MDIFDEKDYYEPDKQSLDNDIEEVNKEDELFDEKELELEPEKEPEEQSKGGAKSANDPEPVYFEKFDDALVSDGQGGYTNLGEAVYAKDSGGRTEINELRNLVDNTDGAVHYKGATTTPISNGSTTNPITIDGESYTAVFGDIVVYNYTEFIFDGTQWSEFGRPFDTTPTSGSANAVTSDGIYKLVRKDTGNGTVVIGGGVGLWTHSQPNMVVCGQYNTARNNDIFEIGAGVNSNNRSNIVEVNSTELNVNGEIKKNGVSLPTPYTTMPTITAAMLGRIAQYVGETTNDYVKGYFYIASSDGAAEPTYSWVSMVDSTPTSDSKNFVTSDGVYNGLSAWRRGYGSNSSAGGMGCSATGGLSLAYGYYATASGYYSASFGNNVSASQYNMLACGKNNKPRTGDLFNVGNGTNNGAGRSNIVEVNSTSMNVNGDIQRNGVGIDDYTTTEQLIGKWIDGSDLYQRTFEVTGLTNGQWNTSILGTSGINIVDVEGWIDWTYNGEPNCRTNLNYYSNSSDYVSLQNTYNDLDIKPNRTDAGMAITDAVITIKYTKIPVQENVQQGETRSEPIVEEEPIEDDMR